MKAERKDRDDQQESGNLGFAALAERQAAAAGNAAVAVAEGERERGKALPAGVLHDGGGRGRYVHDR